MKVQVYLSRHRRVEAYVKYRGSAIRSSGLHGALRMGDATGMVGRI